MEIDIVKDGGRILWNDFAGVYDEKPEHTKISMKQRHRWIKGHWYVAFKQFIPLSVKFIRTLNLKYLDKIFFLMSMGKALHMVLIIILLSSIAGLTVLNGGFLTIVMTTDLVSAWHTVNDYFLYIYGFNILLILYSFGVLPIYSTYKKVGRHNTFKVFIAVQWFMLTDFIVQFIGLYTWPNQGTWVKTPHVKTKVEHGTEILAVPDIIAAASEKLEHKEEIVQQVIEELTPNGEIPENTDTAEDLKS